MKRINIFLILLSTFFIFGNVKAEDYIFEEGDVIIGNTVFHSDVWISASRASKAGSLYTKINGKTDIKTYYFAADLGDSELWYVYNDDIEAYEMLDDEELEEVKNNLEVLFNNNVGNLSLYDLTGTQLIVKSGTSEDTSDRFTVTGLPSGDEINILEKTLKARVGEDFIIYVTDNECGEFNNTEFHITVLKDKVIVEKIGEIDFNNLTQNDVINSISFEDNYSLNMPYEENGPVKNVPVTSSFDLTKDPIVINLSYLDSEIGEYYGFEGIRGKWAYIEFNNEFFDYETETFIYGPNSGCEMYYFSYYDSEENVNKLFIDLTTVPSDGRYKFLYNVSHDGKIVKTFQIELHFNIFDTDTAIKVVNPSDSFEFLGFDVFEERFTQSDYDGVAFLPDFDNKIFSFKDFYYPVLYFDGDKLMQYQNNIYDFSYLNTTSSEVQALIIQEVDDGRYETFITLESITAGSSLTDVILNSLEENSVARVYLFGSANSAENNNILSNTNRFTEIEDGYEHFFEN